MLDGDYSIWWRLKSWLLPSYLYPKWDRLIPGWYKFTYKGDSKIIEIGEQADVSKYADWASYKVTNALEYSRPEYTVLKEEYIERLSKEDKLELL